jgi:hypothetical protein
MMPIAEVPYTTPDGVERSLRFTLGSRKRIAERFKEPDLKKVMALYGDGALPEIAYCMMYDEKGKPPKGLDAEEFAESLDEDAAVPLLAAVMSAADRGRTPKNELEAMLRETMAQTGSISGASPASVSGSPPESSGPAPNESLTPSVTVTETNSAPLPA